MQIVDPPHSTFTTLEMKRLMAYRAAVAAGFYTDWDGSASCTDTELLPLLWRTEGAVADEAAYPFTVEERRGLERCKAALAAGHYADDGAPPAAASATTDDPAR